MVVNLEMWHFLLICPIGLVLFLLVWNARRIHNNLIGTVCCILILGTLVSASVGIVFKCQELREVRLQQNNVAWNASLPGRWKDLHKVMNGVEYYEAKFLAAEAFIEEYAPEEPKLPVEGWNCLMRTVAAKEEDQTFRHVQRLKKLLQPYVTTLSKGGATKRRNTGFVATGGVAERRER